MQKNEDFATALLNFRAKYDLTQTEAAEVLGVHFNSIGYYERGEYQPTKRNVIKFTIKMQEYEKERKINNV